MYVAKILKERSKINHNLYLFFISFFLEMSNVIGLINYNGKRVNFENVHTLYKAVKWKARGFVTYKHRLFVA